MNDIKEQNIELWAINAPGVKYQTSNDMAGTLGFYKKVDRIRYRLEPYLNDLFAEIFKPGLSSLEVGCGLGSDLRFFSRSGLKVTGLDYSPENVYLSKLGLQVFNLSGSVISGDAECLPFPDDSFDLVYSWGCLHHTMDTQKGINELYRVLRPGGKAMVMLYHKGYQFWYILISYLLGCKWIDIDLQTYISFKYGQAPLLQMFSKRQLDKFFNSFNDVGVRVITYGGIQIHPVLKYVWKIFQNIPWLLRRLGSFVVIFASKSGNSPPVKEPPQPCCPICNSALEDNVKCINPSCRARFFIYKGEIQMLHPNTHQIYQGWIRDEGNKKDRIIS